MRVFVTGATGFIGSAIVQELISAGHQVIGLARSDEGAEKLRSLGAEVHRGSLDDLESLKQGAALSDGVIHAAFIHDFSNYAGACEADRKAIKAIGAALAGSGRPLVITSGTALLKLNQLGIEEDAADPNSATAQRALSEELALSLVSDNVRVSIVRLPPSVHGEGDHAFVPLLIGIAREKGVSAYLGDGLNVWPAVHRLDAAHLFRLALEKGAAGAKFHGVADEAVPFRDIAEVIGRRLNLPIVAKPAEEATTHFGWFANFASINNPTSSKLTQERLGWQPNQPTLIADLNGASYFQNEESSILPHTFSETSNSSGSQAQLVTQLSPLFSTAKPVKNSDAAAVNEENDVRPS